MISLPRPSGRQNNAMRDISFEIGVSNYAEGSCLVSFGNSRVLCTASMSDRTPRWMRNSGKGWVTAEYGMLPRSTHERMDREAKRGQSGRTQEIQRLIARSLRAGVDLKKLGERQIIVDCDVINADGGTRTAAICGGFVAMHQAISTLNMKRSPITSFIGAVSCGIFQGNSVLDLDYAEDSMAEADSNFVLSDKGEIIEIQATAEDKPFAEDKFAELFSLAKKGIKEINAKQKQVLGIE